MGKTRRLNREKVVAAAADIANEAGDYRTITLADLASALDIRTPSLYNHIKNLDDLHQALAFYGARQFQLEIELKARGQVGREALVTIAHIYRNMAHQNRGIYPLIIRVPTPDNEAHQDLSAQVVNHMQLLLSTFGLEGDDALHAVRGLRSLIHGFVSLELNGGFGLALSLDESFERLVNVFLDGIG